MDKGRWLIITRKTTTNIMVQITFENLPKIREKFPDKKIVFCSGAFDLTHVGHLLFLEDCKKQGDVLVIAVGSDVSLKKGKGRNVLNEITRLRTIDGFKPVDYALIMGSEENYALSSLEKVFDKLRPDIYVINEDTFDIPYRERVSKKFEVELRILKRYCPPEFEEISTTKVIEKIKRL